VEVLFYVIERQLKKKLNPNLIKVRETES
jgi:hypothetical protein